MGIYCQVCGTLNADEEREYCIRCSHKLLVLSEGAGSDDDLPVLEEESFSFDEHLLERISVLEEALKRTAETVDHLLGVVRKQEEGLLLQEAGLAALREQLVDRGVVDGEEWESRWRQERRARLLALEKRQRFLARRERIVALHGGGLREEFLAWLEAAEEALAALEVEQGLEALEEALALDPGNPELVLFLAETYFNAGELERALGYFERLLAEEPGHYEGLLYSGVIHHELESPEEAARLLGRAVELFPDAFLPHLSLGAALAGEGELERAAASLKRAVELEPAPQALFLLGRCLYDMGRTDSAIRYLREAVRRDPAFEDAHHLLGLVYLDRRWSRKALAAFRQAQRLNPAKLRYGELVQYLSGEEAGPLPEVPETARRWMVRGEDALERDRPREAYEHFQKGLEQAPEHPTLLMFTALACLALNRTRELEAVARKVLAGSPHEMLRSTAYATWMESLRAQGRYQEGNRLGRELLSAASSDFSKAIAYFEMAWNLAEMEQELDQALDFARRALELAPEEFRRFPLAALGWVHYKRREYREAVDFLARSTRLGISARTLTHLGMALLASGDEEEARKVLDEARSAGRGGGVEAAMMEHMRDSSRLLSRLHRRPKT